MSQLSDVVERVRSLDLNQLLHLRPPYPPVAVQFDREALSLVRLKKGRRGLPVLEAVKLCPTTSASVPDSIFQPAPAADDEFKAKLADLFEIAVDELDRLPETVQLTPRY